MHPGKTSYLQNRIVIMAMLGVWIAAIAVSLLLVVPLYRLIKTDIEKNLTLIAKNRALLVKHQLYRYKQIAIFVSGRIHARLLLAQYASGAINKQALIGGSKTILNEAIMQSPEIAGVVRLDNNGTPLLAIGENIPIKSHLDMAHMSNSVEILGVIGSGRGDRRVLLNSPIINHAGKRLGTDIVVLRIDALQGQVDVQPMIHGGAVKVAIFSDWYDHPRLIFPRVESDILFRNTVNEISKLSSGDRLVPDTQARIIQSRNHEGPKNVIAFTPVGESGWAITAIVERNILYYPLVKALLWMMAGVLLLTLTGAIVMRRMMRPLAKEVVGHAEQLLRYSEERFRGLVETTSDWIWEVDSEGRFTYASPMVKKLLGYEPQEVMDKTAFDLMPHEEAMRVREIFQRTVDKHEPLVNLENTNLHKNGERVILETSGVPVIGDDGQLQGYRGVDRDITQRKRVEQELQAYRENLERLVAERTAALERSNRELESYSYSIAHDLRAPLRSVVAFSQIVLEDAGERLKDEQKYLLNRTIKAGKHLTELIDDILELSRITRGALQRQSVDLSSLSQDIADRLFDEYSSEKVDLHIEKNLIVKGDKQLLTVALENLLSNAWKYSSRAAYPRVEVGSMTENGRRIYFIRDNGAGFDMNYVDKLFIPFQRLHPSGEYEGTGIGLATVQRVIQRHGGRVWAEGSEGQGATFFFSLDDEKMDVSLQKKSESK